MIKRLFLCYYYFFPRISSLRCKHSVLSLAAFVKRLAYIDSWKPWTAEGLVAQHPPSETWRRIGESWFRFVQTKLKHQQTFLRWEPCLWLANFSTSGFRSKSKWPFSLGGFSVMIWAWYRLQSWISVANNSFIFLFATPCTLVSFVLVFIVNSVVLWSVVVRWSWADPAVSALDFNAVAVAYSL